MLPPTHSIYMIMMCNRFETNLCVYIKRIHIFVASGMVSVVTMVTADVWQGNSSVVNFYRHSS